MPDVDARMLRLEQGCVTVILLAGFVFQLQWLYSAAAVLPGLDAAFGGAGPTAALWRSVIAPRLKPPQSFETTAAVRAQQLVVFGALVIATLLVLAGLGALATMLAVIVAGVSAAAATVLFCLGAEIDRRSRPRRRGGGRGTDRGPRS